MYRIWGKIMKSNRFKADHIVAIDNHALSKEEKLDMALDEFTLKFDIQKPLWFDKNSKDMKQFGRTQFFEDQFIETIDFDYFEIEIIEDDKKN